MRVPGDLEHPLGVAPAQLTLRSRLTEPLERELADRLEQPVALLAEPSRPAANEALVEQGGEYVEIGVADDLRRFERAAAAEDAHPCEQLLLGLVEQVVRPGDGCPQRRVAFLGVAGAL